MRFEWDDAKDLSNQQKHGLSFAEAKQLFEGNQDYLEIFDAAHSETEDRFIAIGDIDRGIAVCCVYGAGRRPDPHHRSPFCHTARAGAIPRLHGATEMSDIPEITDEQFESVIPARLRARLMRGSFSSGKDIAALRRFVGLSQTDFARAIEISVHTLRNWEQGRRKPDGPALALLKIAARHPRIVRENLESAA